MNLNDLHLMDASTDEQAREIKVQLLRLEKKKALLRHFQVLLDHIGEFDICRFSDFIANRMYTSNGIVMNDTYDYFYQEAKELCELMAEVCFILEWDYHYSFVDRPYERYGTIYEGVFIEEVLDASYFPYIDQEEFEACVQKVILR